VALTVVVKLQAPSVVLNESATYTESAGDFLILYYLKREVKMKEKIQKFGRFLSGMVMPNLGAFVAWGLITALFIPTGWLGKWEYSAELSKTVGPIITYLLPILIGYTGGRVVHGQRGAVVGAVATAGVIVGGGVPMFLGAMIVGPITAYVLKKFDELVDGKIPSGFEMLVANFSAGIIAAIFALIAQIVIGPVVTNITNFFGDGVKAIVDLGLLPLASLVVEPAKILFLNNAINHGVFGPLGLAQVAESGKSIFYLIETNPGPGLGVLLACWFFGKGLAKDSAPSAVIIHFLGGIHEIYFPYVLMNPLLLASVILGGATGVFTFVLLDAGLVAPPSPGSVFALAAMASADLWKVLLGIATSAAVSFFVSSVIYKFTETKADLEEASATSKANKG
jgi:mannitol PTS system EIICBA or EIICB component